MLFKAKRSYQPINKFESSLLRLHSFWQVKEAFDQLSVELVIRRFIHELFLHLAPGQATITSISMISMFLLHLKNA